MASAADWAWAGRPEERAAAVARREPIRVSAVVSPTAKQPERVWVSFRRADGSDVAYWMDRATYRAIPYGTPAAPSDYRKHGTIRPAPKGVPLTRARRASTHRVTRPPRRAARVGFAALW